MMLTFTDVCLLVIVMLIASMLTDIGKYLLTAWWEK